MYNTVMRYIAAQAPKESDIDSKEHYPSPAKSRLKNRSSVESSSRIKKSATSVIVILTVETTNSVLTLKWFFESHGASRGSSISD